MPVFARTGLNDEGFGRFLHQPTAHDFHLEHHRLDVTRDDNIAAPSKNKLRLNAQIRMLQNSAQIRLVFDSNQSKSFCNDMEGIECLKRHIVLD